MGKPPFGADTARGTGEAFTEDKRFGGQDGALSGYRRAFRAGRQRIAYRKSPKTGRKATRQQKEA